MQKLTKSPQLIFFLVMCLGTLGYFFYAIYADRQRASAFRASWSTTLVGRVHHLEEINSDAGILYLNLDTIIGPRYPVTAYDGGQFYLISSGSRAKLVEGGMRKIHENDLITITEAGDFLVLRAGKSIISRPIYQRDFGPFWEDINRKQVKEYWSW